MNTLGQAAELAARTNHRSVVNLAPLVPYLIGAALTLVVQAVIQLYVVPRVETRKRREDRWERNVLELGELLTGALRRCVHDVSNQQIIFHKIRELEKDPHHNRDQIASMRAEYSAKVHQAIAAFDDLVRFRLDWLLDRIRYLGDGSKEIIDFEIAADQYWSSARSMPSDLLDDDNRTEAIFDEVLAKEYHSRKRLLRHVRLLADLQHPPRVRMHRRLMRGGKRIWDAINRAVHRSATIARGLRRLLPGSKG